jgi:hypothetical protein
VITELTDDDFNPETPGVQGIPRSYQDSILTTLHWDDPYASITPEGIQTADFDLVFLENGSVIDNENPENNDIRPVMTLDSATGESIAISSQGQQLNEDGSSTGRDPFELVGLPSSGDPVLQGQWHARLVRGDGSDRIVRTTFFDSASNDPRNLSAEAEAARSDFQLESLTNAEEAAFEATGDFEAAIDAGAEAFEAAGERLGNVDFNGPTIASTSENTNTVGAVDALTNTRETESSGGINRILFGDDGQRLAPERQINVGVTFLGPDNINNTFFGADSADDPDEFPNFCGTSAATPAAAGALLLQDNPDLTPAQLTQLLIEGADGRNDDGTFELGGENRFTGAS